MKKAMVCILSISFFMSSPTVFAGERKLTTYYPAPYGEYKTLKSTEAAAFATSSGKVGIGTIAPTAILDVASTTSGFVPPRVTNAQMTAISSPPAGSLVYNTDKSAHYAFNGTAWVRLLGALEAVDMPGIANFQGNDIPNRGLNKCVACTSGGHSDWRLPDLSEVQYVIQNNINNIATNHPGVVFLTASSAGFSAGLSLQWWVQVSSSGNGIGSLGYDSSGTDFHDYFCVRNS